MKLKQIQKIGQCEHYTIDSKIHKMGTVFEIDDERGERIVARRPGVFAIVEPAKKTDAKKSDKA